MEETRTNNYRFRGTTEHGLDSKGRLNIPARLRDVLAKKYDEHLVLVPWRDCLLVYPLQEWAEVERLLMTGHQSAQKEKLVRRLTGGSAELQIDKNGRILVPVQMRKKSGLVGTVILIGMGTFFEIWGADKYAEMVGPDGEEDFETVEEIFNEINLF